MQRLSHPGANSVIACSLRVTSTPVPVSVCSINGHALATSNLLGFHIWPTNRSNSARFGVISVAPHKMLKILGPWIGQQPECHAPAPAQSSA